MSPRSLVLGAILVFSIGLCMAGDEVPVSDSGDSPVDKPISIVPLPVGVEAPVIMRTPRARPEYPPAAKTRKMEGRVFLKILVREDGTVEVSEVLSCGTKKKSQKKYRDDPTKDCLGFTDSAREAVSQWRYYPATRDGEPVAVDSAAIVEFDI